MKVGAQSNRQGAARAAGLHRAEIQLLHLFGLLPIVYALTASFVFSPEQLERGKVLLSPHCLYKLLTGIDCWSCGLTRAFSCISHGQFERALEYNPLSPLMYVLFVAAGIGLAISWRYFLNQPQQANAQLSHD